MFYAKIQDGCQKWRKNDFLGKSLVDCIHPTDQKFPQNRSISHRYLEINGFLRFTQKFKMAAKSGRKTILEKTYQQTLHIPCGSKILLELEIGCPVDSSCDI